MASNEQKLVDISFELVSTALSNPKFFEGKTQEERMAWVADQLKKCGFPTTPAGLSWGVLDKAT